MTAFIDTAALLRSMGIQRPFASPLVRCIESLTAIDVLSRHCTSAGITRANTQVSAQIAALLEVLHIRYEVALARPEGAKPARNGPVIFYGNHPFGIADALIGLSIALSYRQDTKVLANSILGALDINRDRLIFIDPFEGTSARAANRRGLRETLQHLHDGGALLMFPAGACSHLTLRNLRIADPPWSPHLARLVARTRAAVVPLYFEGHNSWAFQAAGIIHPMLRTLLLLREFLRLSGRTLQVVEGTCQQFHNEAFGGSALAEMRSIVYQLANAGAEGRATRTDHYNVSR